MLYISLDYGKKFILTHESFQGNQLKLLSLMHICLWCK